MRGPALQSHPNVAEVRHSALEVPEQRQCLEKAREGWVPGYPVAISQCEQRMSFLTVTNSSPKLGREV